MSVSIFIFRHFFLSQSFPFFTLSYLNLSLSQSSSFLISSPLCLSTYLPFFYYLALSRNFLFRCLCLSQSPFIFLHSSLWHLLLFYQCKSSSFFYLSQSHSLSVSISTFLLSLAQTLWSSVSFSFYLFYLLLKLLFYLYLLPLFCHLYIHSTLSLSHSITRSLSLSQFSLSLFLSISL